MIIIERGKMCSSMRRKLFKLKNKEIVNIFKIITYLQNIVSIAYQSLEIHIRKGPGQRCLRSYLKSL